MKTMSEATSLKAQLFLERLLPHQDMFCIENQVGRKSLPTSSAGAPIQTPILAAFVTNQAHPPLPSRTDG